MTSLIVNSVLVVVTALPALLYAALVGLGVRSWVRRHVQMPPGIGVTIGVGLSVTSLSIVLSHKFFNSTSLPILPLAAFSLAVILWRGVLAIRERDEERTFVSLFRGMFTPADLIAAAVTILILSPLRITARRTGDI